MFPLGRLPDATRLRTTQDERHATPGPSPPYKGPFSGGAGQGLAADYDRMGGVVKEIGFKPA